MTSLIKIFAVDRGRSIKQTRAGGLRAPQSFLGRLEAAHQRGFYGQIIIELEQEI